MIVDGLDIDLAYENYLRNCEARAHAAQKPLWRAMLALVPPAVGGRGAGSVGPGRYRGALAP